MVAPVNVALKPCVMPPQKNALPVWRWKAKAGQNNGEKASRPTTAQTTRVAIETKCLCSEAPREF